MTSYHLRPARQTEAWAIRRLIWQVHINPTGLDWRRFWVALDEDERLLGCGQIKPHADGSRELASLAVAPAARGRGIARALLLQLVETSPRPLYLRCADRLQEFYEQYRFQVVGPAEMPPSLRRTWQVMHWLKTHWLRGAPALLVMRLDD